MQDESYKYWAFISYSHRDQAWGEWLHRALETYRVPRRLVGRGSAAGPLPRRLFPVFRDQEELPSSPNLSAAIDRALQQSRYLIVIASPYAAVSKWVDQEIARFRSLGRGDRILCLIIDGEPHADLLPDKGFLECFPPALRDIEGVEPIGADVRPGKDGRAAAKLKLIAGLLSVGLDELRRRERRRRFLRNLSWAAAALLSGVVLVSVWVVQQRDKREALAQQALQAHIQTVYEKGRQELIAHNQARAAVFLNETYRLGVDTPALRFMLVRAMRIIDAQRLSFQTGDSVAKIRFSPDSKLLVTVGFDRVARIWSLADTRKLFEFSIPLGQYNVRFSRDSRLVYCTATADGSTQRLFNVWDVASGQRLINLETPASTDSAFNPFDRDSRHLAYLTSQHEAQIIDLRTHEESRKISGDFTVVGFSRDGLRFLAGGADGQVTIWDREASHKLRTLQGLSSPIHEIDDTEDGRLVAASSRDGNIHIWQASDGKLRMTAGHPSPNPGVIFNMDGTRLLTGANDGARVWNTASGQLEFVRQSVAAGGSFAISSYGRWIVEADNGRLAVQDIQSGFDLYTLDAHQGESQAYDISEDDQVIATGGPDGRVVLWNVPRIADAELPHAFDPIRWASEARPPPATAAFSHSGKLMATGAGDGALKIWDVSTHQLVRSIQADARDVDAVAFSEDDSRIVTGGFSEGVKLWDANSGALLLHLDTDGRRVLPVSINRDNSIIAAAFQGGITKLWAVKDGELLASFNRDGARAGAFSPDGKRFVIGMQREVRLWDTTTRGFVWSTSLKGVGTEADALTLSRDGKQIVAAGYGKGAVVLDAGTGSILFELRDGPADKFISADFSPDQQSVVLGELNGGALLWWPRSGVYRTIEGHTGEMRSAVFSPGGKFVLTSGKDATAKLWDASTGELLDTIGELPNQAPEVPYWAASLSPDGQWALVGSTDGVFRLWGLREESRGPEQIALILKCRVPWRLNGDSLQPAAPQSTGCPD